MEKLDLPLITNTPVISADAGENMSSVSAPGRALNSFFSLVFITDRWTQYVFLEATTRGSAAHIRKDTIVAGFTEFSLSIFPFYLFLFF